MGIYAFPAVTVASWSRSRSARRDACIQDKIGA
jgi:hypothetical protein